MWRRRDGSAWARSMASPRKSTAMLTVRMIAILFETAALGFAVFDDVSDLVREMIEATSKVARLRTGERTWTTATAFPCQV